MSNHTIITSAELVSLVASPVVGFYIRFIQKKKKDCAGITQKSTSTQKFSSQRISNAMKNNKTTNSLILRHKVFKIKVWFGHF